MPSMLAKLVFPLFGAYALPVVNAVFLAIVLVRFSQTVLTRVPNAVMVIAVVLSGTPFLVSAILPDIWLAIATVSLLTLLARFSWIDFAICSVALAGHGLDIYVALSLLVLSVICPGEDRWRAARLIASIVVCVVLLAGIANTLVRGSFPAPRLGTAVIVSKVINDVPEAYDGFCVSAPSEKICRLKDKIDKRRALGLDEDSQYLWHAGLTWWSGPVDETLSWPEFNAAGLKLGWHALKSYPFTYVKESLLDYWRMFSVKGCLGNGLAYLEADPGTDSFVGYLTHRGTDSLARRGLLGNTPFCSVVSWAKIIVFAAGLFAALYLFVRGQGAIRRQTILLSGAMFANDFGFAFTSGGFPRYHERIVLLAAVILLLAINRWRQSRQEGL